MKYLSLFSGIGGFELGILNSDFGDDFECIGFSEIDRYAKSIYKFKLNVFGVNIQNCDNAIKDENIKIYYNNKKEKK